MERLMASLNKQAEAPKRLARKQVDAPVTGHEEVHAAGTVNIWTGRVLKEYRKPRENRKKEASAYRCHPKIDSGWTRGEGSGVEYCCLYFARGICHHGHSCDFLHRLPTAQDEERHRTDYSHDIFGRERLPGHMDGRKKGVGSYERECKTLYVHYGGAGTLPTEQVRNIVGDNFGEWGPIENVHLVPSKTLAFIRRYLQHLRHLLPLRYQWRSSAEFAKVAMHQQTLRGCDTTEILDVRWANDDPNPRAVVRVQQEREDALRDAYAKARRAAAAGGCAVNELAPDAKRARIQQLHLAATVQPGLASASYPNTDAQYGGGGGGRYRHSYEGWDQFLYQQQQGEGGGGSDGEAAAGEESADEAGPEEVERDEAAQWAAWQAWQQQHPGGYYPSGAAAADDYTRYMRPEDHYWQQAQEQGWAAGAAGAAAAAAAGTVVVAAQQPLSHQEAEQDEDEAAEQALGLIAGYGSGSDSGGEGEEGGGKER
ncbi:hypothetical protein CHLNCDRAFT_138339 [Chlorella variabilis]|uniref:C3H1-type domain-containing protein n=1 Tax=Chlorella variabilis TaxID=554065 RepID=E1ZMU0_CHLVA|nr:hypothetical protein CHLNCDRAFT_138339 [Chlorella variabilis]EFN52859.1 hypothetical protein CHLNCDRAFT_138339 [Chlorella variabilis]|eukprot:XP_005844961.1 hypothetical protein CHLNCDRAFT_138339 [Chlorella variabilis]